MVVIFFLLVQQNTHSRKFTCHSDFFLETSSCFTRTLTQNQYSDHAVLMVPPVCLVSLSCMDNMNFVKCIKTNCYRVFLSAFLEFSGL